MSEGVNSSPELANIVSITLEKINSPFLNNNRHLIENLFFSMLAGTVIFLFGFFASRKLTRLPGRLQSLAEIIFGGVDDFVQSILGPKGRAFTPFIGTIFIYILTMNLMGLVPLLKSATTNLYTTAALAICVFVYLQYTAVKELGFFGYIDHMMEKPRGIIAFSVFIPVLMLFIHAVSELVRPLSLALRLRSNIWGEDTLLAVMAGFGLKGAMLYLFSMIIAIVGSIVQALVFALLTLIYFALILVENNESIKEEQNGL